MIHRTVGLPHAQVQSSITQIQWNTRVKAGIREATGGLTQPELTPEVTDQIHPALKDLGDIPGSGLLVQGERLVQGDKQRGG